MNTKERFLGWFKSLPAKTKVGVGIAGVALIAVLGFYVFSGKIGDIFPFFVPSSNYSPVYQLVSDKISQHSGIVVNLPEGVDLGTATTTSLVTFTPELKGEWVSSTLAQALVYKPAAAMTLGKHYEVSLATLSGAIRKDFIVDEDPRVVEVFPDDKAEAELRSAITITFNRPMVPLTTLGTLDGVEVPVTISPATKGKFKWISTRTLQFIPETSLAGSAHYTVTVGTKLISFDGLPVPPGVFSFTTKSLRLTYATTGTQVYNKPIQFFFNQPVDLEKIKGGIKLVSGPQQTPMPVAASYGEKTVYGADGKGRQIEDKTLIEVLPDNLLHGQKNVWDFETLYAVTIANAYPVGGDIMLAGPLYSQIITTPIIAGVTAASAKTTLASADLFDPAGTSTVSFYEDIDIGASKINAKGLANISYGEKCKDADVLNKGYGYYNPGPCEKMADRSQLVLSFSPNQKFARGEKIPVVFERVVNAKGATVNDKPITVMLTVYPELQILSTAPRAGDPAGSITDFVLCTNVPLKTKNAAEFARDVKADKYLVFSRFDNAYLQSQYTYELNPPCKPQEYVSRIHYGILPKKAYKLELAVEDVFGAKANTSVAFTSGPAPRFFLDLKSFQKMYNVTTPGHTKLTYAAQNFPSVSVTVCKLDPREMVRELSREPRSITDVQPDFSVCSSVKTDQIALPQDQWLYHYFQLDLAKYFEDTRGQYRISLSNPAYTDYQGRGLYSQTYVSVTNLAIVEKRVQWNSEHYYGYGPVKDPTNPLSAPADTRGSLYFVTDSASLTPIGQASIKVYSRDGSEGAFTLERSGSTDVRGIAEFPLTRNVVGAVVTSADGADAGVVTSWADTMSSGAWDSARDSERIYVYTDRPIYRPGQEVFFKGIHRVNFDGLYKDPSGGTVSVKISNSKGEQMLSQNLPLTAYGTFASSIKLPANAALGTYYISSDTGGTSFTVAAYAAAAFDAQAQSNKDEYVAGETATVDVSAKYYFGVPLDGGTLSWSLTSQDYYFDRYQDEYFNFGAGWYSCPGCGYGDSYHKSGTTNLDEAGLAQVRQSLDFGELFSAKGGSASGGKNNVSKIFVFHGTVKDKQGRSVSFQRSFIVHRGSFYLGIKADPSFVAADAPFTLRAKTVDTKGKPTSEGGLSYSIGKVSWQSFKRQEVDGGFYDRSERVVTPVETDTFRTDGDGNYSDEISLREPGEYEITAKGGNDGGITSTTYLYVYGSGQAEVRPTNNATLDLKASVIDVKVGDRASFIIQNPYPHARALVTIERGRIFTYDILDITQNVYQYSFPVTAEYSPNVYASVVLLSEGSGMKFGNLQFYVDRSSKKLSIDIRTNKEAYLPGEQVTLTVKTTDALGRPVPANVSLAVADLSVLALAGNPKKDPLIFFYDGFPLTVATEVNTKNKLAETAIPTGTKGGSGGGADGLANKTRGEFKDTAFWRSDITTDAAGLSQVTFTLPDNLTKWQVESVGITKDTLVGAAYKEVVAQKKIMAVPIIPRFVVPGDEFMVGVKIFNQTEESQPLSVSIKSPTLKLQGSTGTTRTVGAGKTDVVYFSAVAPPSMDQGAHTLTLSAVNEDFNDTVTQTIPITRNTTYEASATAGGTTDAVSKEYLFLPGNAVADQGGVTIKTSATLALYLTDALQYMFDYPYGCAEQIASKLRAVAIGKRVLALPNVGTQFVLPQVSFDGRKYTVDDAVAIGLKKLLDAQNVDGGFAYYKGLQSYPSLTVTVLQSLLDLRRAGYAISQTVLDSAANYAYGKFLEHGSAYYRANPYELDSLIIALPTLQRVDSSSRSYYSMLGMVSDLATQSYLSDKANSLSLGTLALFAADKNSGISAGLKERVFSTLQNRVAIDSRGAYVRKGDGNQLWSYYETREKDTALLLQALAADRREYSQTDNLIRTLMGSRSKDGSWGSTNTSAAVLDAVAQYLEWKKETTSRFTLEALLDAKSVARDTFGPDNILRPAETFLPMEGIEKDELHLFTFSKQNLNGSANKMYYDLSLKYFLPADLISPRDEGFAVSRGMYALTDAAQAKPLKTVKVGEVVRGVVTIVSPKERHFFSLEDFIPAGFELVDFSLATEDKSSTVDQATNQPVPSGPPTETPSFDDSTPLVAQRLHADFEELRDDRLFLFRHTLPEGAYQYEYYLRATTPGTFRHLPAVASEMYYPENFGRTGGGIFEVAR